MIKLALFARFEAKPGKEKDVAAFLNTGLQLDDHEDLQIEKISIAELKKLFLENKIVQATHNNCIFYALRVLGEL